MLFRSVASIFSDRDFVQKYSLTVANTTNVCRLLSQLFFFPYSFAQIKNKVKGELNYAMDSGNYGTLMAGLYSWRFALPVSKFYLPSTTEFQKNVAGNPVILDSFVNLSERGCTSPVIPANLERLESFFGKNELMMRNFVSTVDISERKREKACKELFMNYGVFADKSTASAYAVIKENEDAMRDEDMSFVLMAYNHPALSSDYCRHVTGEVPETPDYIKKSLLPSEVNKSTLSSVEDIKEIIKSL